MMIYVVLSRKADGQMARLSVFVLLTVTSVDKLIILIIFGLPEPFKRGHFEKPLYRTITIMLESFAAPHRPALIYTQASLEAKIVRYMLDRTMFAAVF